MKVTLIVPEKKKLKIKNYKVKEEYEFREIKFQLSPFLHFRYTFITPTRLAFCTLICEEG